MKAEEKVKRMFPDAIIERVQNGWRKDSFHFRVTIKSGRYTYGRLKSWAWVEALQTIQQDAELLRDAKRPAKPVPNPTGVKSLTNPINPVTSV